MFFFPNIIYHGADFSALLAFPKSSPAVLYSVLATFSINYLSLKFSLIHIGKQVLLIIS